jgi:3-hydroxyisobutyrate dehydrogenase-like beta-hydroxyacid dehydrogenase
VNRSSAVGLIGLGAMGFPIAQRLLDRRRHLVVFDVDAGRIDEVVRLGGSGASSPAVVAAMAQTVLLVLPGPKEVREALLGPGGLLTGTTRPGLVVDLTTSDPAMSREMAAVATASAVDYVDAGILGNPPTARDGRMILLTGGADAALAAAEQVLPDISATRHHVGGVGAGHTAKLAANELFTAQVAAMGEALAILLAAGVQQEAFLAALAGTGGRGAGLADIGTTMLGDPPAVGFALRLAAKDALLTSRLASEHGQPSPLADALAATFNGAAAQHPTADYTSVYQHIVQRRATMVSDHG